MMNRTSNPRTVVPLLIGGAAVTAGAIAAYRRVVRPWYLRWGATEQEVRRVLPGDALVSNPQINYTRAITINVAD